MADIKINDLTAYTNPVSTDVLPIVDIGNDLTKKVEIRNLLKNATGGSATAPSFSFDADPDTGMYKSGTNALAFTTAGNGRLFIDSSGNIGVGTASPSQPLDVAGWVKTSVGLLGTTGRVRTDSGGINISTGATANPIIFTGGTGSANVERMRIDSSGNVLIGANSVSNITGYSQLVLNNSTGGLIEFQDSGSSVGRVVSIANSMTLRTDGELIFETNGSDERMRIRTDGFTRVFSTSTGVFSSETSTAAGTSAYLYQGVHSRTSIGVGGAASIRIYTNGNVVNTNNSYGALSDVKLKENIVNANSQWDDLKAIQVRNYNFIGGETHTQIGVVAQEVELVSPGLVTETPDRDDDDNDLGTVTKMVNYSVLYMKAVKALQEAMERIETLEAKVAALEG